MSITHAWEFSAIGCSHPVSLNVSDSNEEMIVRDEHSEEEMMPELGIQMPLFFFVGHKQVAPACPGPSPPHPPPRPLPTLLPERSSVCPRNHALPVLCLPGTSQGCRKWTRAQLAEPVPFRDTAPDPEAAGMRAPWGPASQSMLGLVSKPLDMNEPLKMNPSGVPAFPFHRQPGGTAQTRRSPPYSQRRLQTQGESRATQG